VEGAQPYPQPPGRQLEGTSFPTVFDWQVRFVTDNRRFFGMIRDRESLGEFFTTAVDEAVESQNVGLSETASGYLTGLLVRLSRTRELSSEAGPITLADLHIKARSAGRVEALSIYRQLGDTALFVSGFFSESLERRRVSLRYYTDMGGAAYHRVAGLADDAGERAGWSDLFQELAHRFEDCVGVLTEVADRDRTESVDDLVRLYRIWATTRSPYAARRLARLGLIPGVAPSA